MEDDNFGVYNFYFSVVKHFGTFPYNVEQRQKNLKIVTSRAGPIFLLYLINFAAATYHAFFQLTQLFCLYLERTDRLTFIEQTTWTLLSLIPLVNYLEWMGEEKEFAKVVNEWCHLERTILGSTFRGVSRAKDADSELYATPTLSTCHFKQKVRFKLISGYYLILVVIGGIAVGNHAYYSPDHPSYIYSLIPENKRSEGLLGASVAFQLWIYCIIWSNVYAIEVMSTIVSSSIGHILETLSYRGGVVMTRWTCDHIPVVDLPPSSKWSPEDEQGNEENECPQEEQEENNEISNVVGSSQECNNNSPKKKMRKIMQNLVDIQYGLDGYLKVESLVEGYNHTFGSIIPGHLLLYLLILVIQGFNAIQNFAKMHVSALIMYCIVIALFLLRMITFFPAMGDLDRQSDSFIDSWMEGLRYVPKGRQSYELYWYKIKSCRLLDFRCGRYFNIERKTCPKFLFKVTEFVIVLLQIFY